jgi:hypothetical protein
VLEGDPVSVQEHALEGAARVVCLLKLLVQGKIAVFLVTCNREAARGQVHADLVRAPGLELGFQQGKAFPLAQQVEHGMRFLAAGLHHHAALAVRSRVFMQRQLDVLARIGPVAAHQGQVALVGTAFAHLLVQVGEGRTFLGQQQQARGFAVEAVHQFQELGLRPRRAQLLDDAIRHARAAMHGNAGRLVDDEQVAVLVDDGNSAPGTGALPAAFSAVRIGGMRTTSPACRRYN